MSRLGRALTGWLAPVNADILAFIPKQGEEPRNVRLQIRNAPSRRQIERYVDIMLDNGWVVTSITELPR